MKDAKRIPRIVGGFLIAIGILGYDSGWAQETVVARAALIEGPLPADDPSGAAWNSAPVVEFPLSPQVHWPTRIGEVTVKSVKVRGLHNGQRLAIMVEYEDPAEDPDDAAGLEFMVGDKKAHFAHGQPMAQVKGGPVNIWFWKNKEGKAVDMNAQGFGTLKAQAHQDVTAKGVYKNGTWRVVFSRELGTAHPDQDTQFQPGEFTNIALAVWDGKPTESGAPKEKGSQKAVSSWWYFRAEPPPDRTPLILFFAAVGGAAALEIIIVRKIRNSQSAQPGAD